MAEPKMKGKINPIKLKGGREIEVYREIEWKTQRAGGGVEWKKIGRHNTVAARRMRKPGESGGEGQECPRLALPSLSPELPKAHPGLDPETTKPAESAALQAHRKGGCVGSAGCTIN